MSDFPAWPAKLTREQQNAVKRRDKDFDAALKLAAKATGWRHARGTVFRQSGDWFIGMLPSLLWEHGAIVRMMVKPMALDPLFWDIVGLNENEALPLSFRAKGAWVLRPPWTESFVGLNSAEVQPLAKEVLGWANEWTCKMLETISVESMLKSLVSEQTIRGQNLALATCLHILMRDLNGAMDLCRIDDPDLHPMMRDSGGFTTHNHDGSSSTFLDQARDWIARKRRDELSIV